MKQIVNYINEKLHITSKQQYSCQPKTKRELRSIIIERIQEDGQECNLNDIDVSNITDMSCLFDAFDNKIFNDFNGDISLWNVSNVKDMYAMFNWCEQFNCDLSRWDVSKVTHMEYMFYNCKKFKQNIDGWNVSKDVNMWDAFYGCPTQPIWYED